MAPCWGTSDDPSLSWLMRGGQRTLSIDDYPIGRRTTMPPHGLMPRRS
jgi:hypothetical protein